MQKEANLFHRPPLKTLLCHVDTNWVTCYSEMGTVRWDYAQLCGRCCSYFHTARDGIIPLLSTLPRPGLGVHRGGVGIWGNGWREVGVRALSQCGAAGLNERQEVRLHCFK